MFRVLALLLLLPLQAVAAPESYRLDAARSSVAFTFVYEGQERTGQMPVRSADIALDLGNLPASRVSVALDASAARAGFVFATEAMKSASVLDTARHPMILFRATSISGTTRAATVRGQLTIRGVTRPVSLRAVLYRQAETEPDDLSDLTVLLTGSVDRNAFGATGYPGQVGDRIGLRILARIVK